MNEHQLHLETRAPVLVGIGKTGLRVANQVASRSDAIKPIVYFPENVPGIPARTMIRAWPSDRVEAAKAAAELTALVAGAPSVVLVFNLGAKVCEHAAPAIAKVLRPAARNLAAVCVAPFSFEGTSRVEQAEVMLREVGPLMDVAAVASRDNVRPFMPEDTPLEKACAAVDGIASSAAEVLAWVMAKGIDKDILAGGACQIGSGEASGRGGLAAAARNAMKDSLLPSELIGGARGAMLAAALSHAPSLGELGDLERAVRAGMSRGASFAFEFAVERSLGERAIVAACLLPAESKRAAGLFPAENPETWEVPAYIRKRRAGRMPAALAEPMLWRRSA